MPFSRGQRNCLGMKYVGLYSHCLPTPDAQDCYSLAWCELYLIFSSMYRRVDLELCNSRYVLSVMLNVEVLTRGSLAPRI